MAGLTEESVLDSRYGQEVLYSTQHSGLLRDQSSPLSKPTEGYFPRIKQSGREADDLHPSSAEVKNAWDFSILILVVAFLYLEDYLHYSCNRSFIKSKKKLNAYKEDFN
jgi:hypothetical protein